MYEEEYDDDQDFDIQELIQKYEDAIKNDENTFFPSEAFEQLIDFYEEHEQWKKAELLIELAMEQHPYITEFMCRKAELLLDRGDNEGAEILIDKAISLDPLDCSPYFLKSDLYCNLEQYDLAIETLEYAIQYASDEDLSDVYLEMADVYEEWGNFEAAYEAIKKAILNDPSNEEALDRIWFLMEYLTNYKESIVFYNKIIDKDPYNYLTWYNLGNAYLGLNNYPEAIDAFEMVIAINENYEYAYSDLGDLYVKMEQYAKAIEYFEKAMEYGKPSEDMYFQIGLCYELLGQPGKARTHYRKATRLDHEFHEAYHHIGKSFFMQEDYEKALNAYSRAFKIDSTNTEYHHDIALTLYQLQDYTESCQFCLNLTELKQNYLHAWLLLLANIYRLHDDEFFDGILSLAKIKCEYSPALDLMEGAIYLLMGKKVHAEEIINTALQQEENELIQILYLLPELEKQKIFRDYIFN